MSTDPNAMQGNGRKRVVPTLLIRAQHRNDNTAFRHDIRPRETLLHFTTLAGSSADCLEAFSVRKDFE
ncbi:MAG: hypothetical protein ACLGJC_31905 [Alphaproteobacteria bacterium]